MTTKLDRETLGRIVLDTVELGSGDWGPWIDNAPAVGIAVARHIVAHCAKILDEQAASLLHSCDEANADPESWEYAHGWEDAAERLRKEMP